MKSTSTDSDYFNLVRIEIMTWNINVEVIELIFNLESIKSWIEIGPVQFSPIEL